MSGDLALRERIVRVAGRAIHSPYFLWDWGEAVAIQALMIASDVTGETRFREWAVSRLDLWRQIHPDPFWPDHLGPGVALVWHARRTGDPAALDYAIRLGNHLGSLPRARTGARLLRPDKPDIESFVWVDSLYSDGPFLCELGHTTGNEAFIDDAASHTEGLCRSLQDPATGLFAHRYDDATGTTNRVSWGRGCGWAALGLGHTLATLPTTHPTWQVLADRFALFAATVRDLQTDSGHWSAVLDNAATQPEASTTALIGEGLALGIGAGVLDPAFQEVVMRAWDAVGEDVANDGRVGNVSQRSPSSTSWEAYSRLPHGGCYTWGQGPWLLFASRFLARAATGTREDGSPLLRPVPGDT